MKIAGLLVRFFVCVPWVHCCLGFLGGWEFFGGVKKNSTDHIYLHNTSHIIIVGGD